MQNIQKQIVKICFLICLGMLNLQVLSADALLTVQKSWVNANVNDAVSITTTGGTNNVSFASIADLSTEVDIDLTVYPVLTGETLTFNESFTTGASGDYNSVLSCTGATDTVLSDGLTISILDAAITCTYVNTLIPRTLIVQKSWINATLNDAVNIATTGGSNNVSFASTADTSTELDIDAAITLVSGETLTFNETFTTGSAGDYTSVLSCTGAVDTNLADGLTIDIADTAVVCTYVNTLIPPLANLTIVKAVNNDNGGVGVVGDFGLLTDAGALSFGAGVTVGPLTTYTAVELGVSPGTYSLSEQDLAGYTEGVWSCVGGTLLSNTFNAGSISLANGDNAICTITNDDILPLDPVLTLVKTVVGGTALATEFTLTATGSVDVISGVLGDVAITNAMVTADSYVLSETSLPNYIATDLVCVNANALGTDVSTVNLSNATVTLAPLDVVVCTHENTYVPLGILTLNKFITNDNGGTATLSDFTLSAIGPQTITGVTGDIAITNTSLTAGLYALSEIQIAGYQLTTLVCVNANLTGTDVSSVSLTNPNVIIASLDIITCTYTNDDEPQIVANVESFTAVNGVEGGATLSVVSSDTLGGNPVNIGTAPGDISLAVDSILNPSGNPTTDLAVNADGTVVVPANTPVGNYQITYTICEISTPSNCSSVTETIPVVAASIVASQETFAPVNGNTGGSTPSVVAGDTLNGSPVTIGTNPGDVTLTIDSVLDPSGNVTSALTVNPDGTVTVAANTPAGNYSVTYTICEVTNPSNCSSVTETIPVEFASLSSTTETFAPVNGNTGGTTTSVVASDTLNGNPVTIGTNPGDVNLTVDSILDPNGNPATTVILNPDGTVTVQPNSPAGDYQVTYTICEITNPANCSTVTEIVMVIQPEITALDDNAVVINGLNGATGFVNVLDNDTFNNDSINFNDVNISVVSTNAPGILVLNSDGSVDMIPNEPPGTYTLVYQICDKTNPTNCSTAELTILVNQNPPIAEDDSVVTDIDETIRFNILANDRDQDIGSLDQDSIQLTNPVDGNSDINGVLDVTGVGIYTINSGGDITFDPDINFAGQTNIEYIVRDNDGLPSNSAVIDVLVAGEVAVGGNVWQDSNKDGEFNNGEQAKEGWLVEVYDENGVLIGTTTIQTDGSYSVDGLLADMTYKIVVINITSGAVFAVVEDVVVTPDDAGITENIAIDPSGVIYNSITRQPIPGAIAELLDANGLILPDECLFAGQQSQTVGADGLYKFDIVVSSGNPVCTAAATVYFIRVIEPDGYLQTESTLIPAQPGVEDATGKGIDGFYQVVNFDTAPQFGQSTKYFFAFEIGLGDPNVVNNHIPLDPIGLGESSVSLLKKTTAKNIRVGDLVPYTIQIENLSTTAISNLQIIDDLPAGFTIVAESVQAYDIDNSVVVSGIDPVTISNIDIPFGETIEVKYITRVGSGVVRGTHVNTVLPYLSGVVVGNQSSAKVIMRSDELLEEATVIGKVWNDRDVDNWQDSANATGIVIRGGISSKQLVANSTRVIGPDGLEIPIANGVSLISGIEIGSLSGRNSIADPLYKHTIVVSQLLSKNNFTNDFVLNSKEGSTLHLDTEGNISKALTSKLAAGKGSQDLNIERLVSLEGDLYRVDFLISNKGLHEGGIPGARVASVEGLISVTDAYGRFHMAGIDVANISRGHNFILKVDPHSLPKDTIFVTENPRVRRVTQGLLQRFDFAVQIPEQELLVSEQSEKLEVTQLLFTEGTANLKQKYTHLLDEVASLIRRSGKGDLYIKAYAGNEALALERAQIIHESLLAKVSDVDSSEINVHVVTQIAETVRPVATVNSIIRLGEVFFATGSSKVNKEFQAVLEQVAERLLKENGGIISVVGHTDSSGSDSLNQKLSEERALSVVKILSEKLAKEDLRKIQIHFQGNPEITQALRQQGGH